MSHQSRPYVKGHTNVLSLSNDSQRPFTLINSPFMILYNRRRGVSHWGKPMSVTHGHIKTHDKHPTRLRGRVKWFNTEKSYGYIAPEDGTHDILLDQTESAGETARMTTPFHQGDCVEFEVFSNHQHRPTATNVCRIADPSEKHGRTKNQIDPAKKATRT